MNNNIGQYQVLFQEKETKIAELMKENEEFKKENEELRRIAKRPKAGDLSSWIENLNTLFSTKKDIHEKILKLESKEKITRWRMKYKHSSAERVHAFDNSDDEVRIIDRIITRNRLKFINFSFRM